MTGQLLPETLRDEPPAIAAVDKDAIALASPLPQNDAPHHLAERAMPKDAMLTPTVTEVVARMLKDRDDGQSLNGRVGKLHEL